METTTILVHSRRASNAPPLRSAASVLIGVSPMAEPAAPTAHATVALLDAGVAAHGDALDIERAANGGAYGIHDVTTTAMAHLVASQGPTLRGIAPPGVVRLIDVNCTDPRHGMLSQQLMARAIRAAADGTLVSDGGAAAIDVILLAVCRLPPQLRAAVKYAAQKQVLVVLAAGLDDDTEESDGELDDREDQAAIVIEDYVRVGALRMSLGGFAFSDRGARVVTLTPMVAEAEAEAEAEAAAGSGRTRTRARNRVCRRPADFLALGEHVAVHGTANDFVRMSGEPLAAAQVAAFAAMRIARWRGAATGAAAASKAVADKAVAPAVANRMPLDKLRLELRRFATGSCFLTYQKASRRVVDARIDVLVPSSELIDMV